MNIDEKRIRVGFCLQLRVVVARVTEAHTPGSLLMLRVTSEPFTFPFSRFLVLLIVLVSLDSGAQFLHLRMVVARVMEAHAPGSFLMLRVTSEPFSLPFSRLLVSLTVLVSLDSGARFHHLRVVAARVMEAHAPGSFLILRVTSEPFSLPFSRLLVSLTVLVSLDSGARFHHLRVVVARVMEAHAPGSLLMVRVSSEPFSLLYLL